MITSLDFRFRSNLASKIQSFYGFIRCWVMFLSHEVCDRAVYSASSPLLRTSQICLNPLSTRRVKKNGRAQGVPSTWISTTDVTYNKDVGNLGLQRC